MIPFILFEELFILKLMIAFFASVSIGWIIRIVKSFRSYWMRNSGNDFYDSCCILIILGIKYLQNLQI